jgi:hypothetical protein
MHGAQTLEAAARTTQVLARGGPRWLARVLAGGPWGASFDRPAVEARRARAIAWMCRRTELEPAHLPAILHVVDAWPNFSLAGRTVASVLRLVVAPPMPPRRPAHASDTGRLEPFVRRWGPSGLQPLGDRGRARASWTVTELRNSTQLLCEGRMMRHCVERYDEVAEAGTCSLWSVRARGLPVLTLEVRGDRIVQARGHGNRRPTATELAVVRRWARLNALRLD